MYRINHKRTQKKSEPQMGFEPTTLCVLDQMLSGIGWLVGGSFVGETFLAINVTVWYSEALTMCCFWWTVWLRDAVRKPNPQKNDPCSPTSPQ